MDQRINDRLALFASNAQLIKKDFRWHYDLIKRLVAFLYAQENKPVDGEAIRQCHTMMKQKTGLFSTFRGNMALCVATLLSLSSDAHSLFDNTLAVYDLLKRAGLRVSDYLVVAAYLIAAQTEPVRYQDAVERTRIFYDGMKARHFFHTGQEDYIFTAMLGLSDLDTATGTERIEQIFSQLKGSFWDKNSVQSLAQVLALGGSDDAAVSRVLTLREAFRANKIRLDKSYTLPTLGIFALLGEDKESVIRDVQETQQLLSAQKGFSAWSVTTQERLIYVAAIVAGVYAENAKQHMLTATVSTSITQIIIAQQAAFIAAASASAAAAAASSS